MLIEEMRIVEFHGVERSGRKKNGEQYRSRTAEVSWFDEETEQDNRTMARLTTEACNDFDRMHLEIGEPFTASVTFSLSKGHTGYKFTNCFINQIY